MIPESHAAERVAGLLSRHLPGVLCDEFWKQIGGKVVANRHSLRGMFDELDADPDRLGERDVVLRRQAANEVESAVWWEEHAAHLKREYLDAMAILERVRRGTLAEYDPDARGAQEDDDRLSQERADEKARDQAVRL